MHSELAVLQASNTVSTYNSFNSKSVIVHQPVYWAIIALAIGHFVPSVTKSCKHSLAYSVFIPFKVVLGVPVPDTSSDPLFLFRWCCVRTQYTLRGAWMMSWHMSWYMHMTIAELGWTGTNWNIWHAQKWVVMRFIITIGMLDCLQLFSDFLEILYYSLQVTMSNKIISIIIYNDMNCVYRLWALISTFQPIGVIHLWQLYTCVCICCSVFAWHLLCYHVHFALASLKCMFLTVSNCEGCMTGSQGGNKDELH